MSPTVFRHGPYRFFFFSREEPRLHVHVRSADGEAKFWLEPTVALADYAGYSARTGSFNGLWRRTKMASEARGDSTLEIMDLSRHGIWLRVHDSEFFLSFEQFPWFEEARVKDILDVRLEGDEHLHWPALDVDLSLDMLAHPERYPLVAR